VIHPAASKRRQRYVAEYVLPDGLGRNLYLDDPQIEKGPLLRGLRQWLRLRVLTGDIMGMPSLGVWGLWRQFIAQTDTYSEFCQHAFGHAPTQSERPTTAPGSASVDQLALTWAMACEDEHLKPTLAHQLPYLFDADDKAGIHSDLHWVLRCGHSKCTASAGQRCVQHEIVPRLPERLPKQIHFGEPRPPGLFDKSDSLTTPNGFYGY
jgi:hypothetical protein